MESYIKECCDGDFSEPFKKNSCSRKFTKDKINQFTDTAISYLDQFPDNLYKQSMIDLALYNAERTR